MTFMGFYAIFSWFFSGYPSTPLLYTAHALWDFMRSFRGFLSGYPSTPFLSHTRHASMGIHAIFSWCFQWVSKHANS